MKLLYTVSHLVWRHVIDTRLLACHSTALQKLSIEDGHEHERVFIHENPTPRRRYLQQSTMSITEL
jgi:hypothetical protein